MAWEDDAPILSSLGITEVQADTFFNNHAPDPVSVVQPVITKPKVVAIANIMFDGVHIDGIAAYGGVVKIAQEAKLTTAQVTAIVSEIRRLYAAWSTKEE